MGDLIEDDDENENEKLRKKQDSGG